jgi:hypothetical protein
MNENEEAKSVEYRSETRSSITVTRNSKGYNWEIKTYYQDGEESKALNTTSNLDAELRKKYGG